jgi:hypothetical protein
LKSALEPEEDGSPLGTVWKLNKNVTGLRGLANACMNADSVALFNIEYNDDGSVLYWLSMKVGGDIDLYSEIVSQEICVPELSMQKVGGSFYWMVNGVFLTDSNGEQISVIDVTKPISFLLHDKSICCRVKNSVVAEFPFTKADYLAKDVAIDYDMDNRGFNIRLSSGFKSILPAISEFHLIDSSVKNRSFYKDVFLDAGVALTSRKSLAAANHIGLSLEGVSLPYSSSSEKHKELQTAIIAGDSNDFNGRLLYPDGQPRFRLLFVNGGDSTPHGQSLGEKGRANMRAFVANGGCYVGTCAGAFLASNGFDGKPDYPYYLSIWPGMMNHTGLSQTYSGMFIENNSPLLRYYDFGGDHYVDSVRHNSGGYPVVFPLKTEVLARYDYPKKGPLHRKPSVWAYKESLRSGRVVLEGSHPEEVLEGERRDLTAAMMLYAMDGVGIVSLKGYLKNGVERKMDKNTTNNNPAYARIGDRQTHHFATYLPPDARSIRVELDSPSDCDFALMMNQGTYAFSDEAEYRSSVPGAKQQLSFSALREGLWFIAVQCLTTVTVKETDYGQEYGGKTEVLNGVPYTISISWE